MNHMCFNLEDRDEQHLTSPIEFASNGTGTLKDYLAKVMPREGKSQE